MTLTVMRVWFSDGIQQLFQIGSAGRTFTGGYRVHQINSDRCDRCSAAFHGLYELEFADENISTSIFPQP